MYTKKQVRDQSYSIQGNHQYKQHDPKYYIGMTSNTFKERFRNNTKSFTHKKYSNETELSKYVFRNMAFERK